eukprot:6176716-Pleurochrysis_carterae.AAC.2
MHPSVSVAVHSCVAMRCARPCKRSSLCARARRRECLRAPLSAARARARACACARARGVTSRLRDGGEHAALHQILDHLGDADVTRGGEVAHRDRVADGDLQRHSRPSSFCSRWPSFSLSLTPNHL